MAITFDKLNRLIIVAAPQTTITIQELVDAIRPFEAQTGSSAPGNKFNIGGIDFGQIGQASGKQDLGGGVLVGITLELLNDWRVKFEDRAGPSTVQCRITGGNLVATNSYSNNPVAPSLFVFVTLTSSSSATIALLDIINLKNSIESQRDTHSGFGDIWYWDPYSGDDLNNGTSPTLATKTFAQAQTLAGNNNNDIIFVMNSSPSAQFATAEVLTITSNRLYVRASPKSIVLTPTASNITSFSNYAVGIMGIGVEVCGFYIAPTTAIHIGISISGDFALVHNTWIKDNILHGIRLAGSSGSNIHHTYVDDATEDGIIVDDWSYNTTLGPNLTIEASGENGISIEIARETYIEKDNFVTNSASAGISISSVASGTIVRSGNVVNSALGFNLTDYGTGTVIEDLELQNSFYGDEIKINQEIGEVGTQYPIGTPARPVNNFTDALTIAMRIETRRLHIISGAFNIDASLAVTGFNFIAEPANTTNLNFQGGSIDQSSFDSFGLSGYLPAGEYSYFSFCDLTLSGVWGYLDRCGLVGLNIMDNTATDQTIFDNCAGIQYDATVPSVLDFNKSSFGAQFIEWDGEITFKNHGESATSILDFDSGKITIDPSCSGVFVMRGNGRVVNNSSSVTARFDLINSSNTGVSVIGGVTVTGVTASVNSTLIAEAVWGYPTTGAAASAGTMGEAQGGGTGGSSVMDLIAAAVWGYPTTGGSVTAGSMGETLTAGGSATVDFTTLINALSSVTASNTSQIASAVWVNSGTSVLQDVTITGLLTIAVTAAVDGQALAADVWGYNTTGLAISTGTMGTTVTSLASAVWTNSGTSVLNGINITGVTAGVDGLAIANAVWGFPTSGTSVSSGSFGEALSATHQVQTGRWRMFNNQLVIYDADGVTTLQAFDLFDSSGNPSLSAVVHRVPI